MNHTPSSEVYLMDCMDLMKQYPDNHFELAICDPPYKDEIIGLSAGFNREHFNYSTLINAPTIEYINEVFRVSKNQIMWGFNYYLKLLPNTDACIIWSKHQNGHFSEAELAWCSFGKTRVFDRAYQKDIGDKIHPTQKPIQLYEFCMTHYAKQGDKVLDTHLGSQSSRIAAHKLGFDFVGSELDPDYFRDGCKRFEQYKSQLTMQF